MRKIDLTPGDLAWLRYHQAEISIVTVIEGVPDEMTDWVRGLLRALDKTERAREATQRLLAAAENERDHLLGRLALAPIPKDLP